jgi:transcriptional regulator with XRE-family HTH domain
MEKEELKRRRSALGWTQKQLAEALGVKPNTVTRWENGVLPVPVYVPLALATLEREQGKKKGGKK